MTSTQMQSVKTLIRSNAVKNLHDITNTNELNEEEKSDNYDLLVKQMDIKLENITQEPEIEKTCVFIEKPECCICMEEIICQEETTFCGHKFHINCINKWCETNNVCPMCRICNPIGITKCPTAPTGNTEENTDRDYINNNNCIIMIIMITKLIIIQLLLILLLR